MPVGLHDKAQGGQALRPAARAVYTPSAEKAKSAYSPPASSEHGFALGVLDVQRALGRRAPPTGGVTVDGALRTGPPCWARLNSRSSIARHRHRPLVAALAQLLAAEAHRILSGQIAQAHRGCTAKPITPATSSARTTGPAPAIWPMISRNQSIPPHTLVFQPRLVKRPPWPRMSRPGPRAFVADAHLPGEGFAAWPSAAPW